jgi:GNAT superfamily N-acetyltransferase
VYTSAFEPKRIFVARVDGRIVGRSIVEWSNAPGSESSWVTAEVLPECRRRGIGTALFERVETLALQSGRPILQAEALHRPLPGGDRLAAPTGFGDLPTGDDGVRFLLSRGYRLEQVERVSVLDLPIDPAPLRRVCADVIEAAGGQYRPVRWTGTTPPERIGDLLTLHAGMATDAPAAGLVIEDEEWTPARLEELENAAQANGRLLLTSAVEHSATGRLIGFSDLTVPADRRRPAHQGDTLVLRGHRGHRLGLLMKAVNLLALNEIAPSPPHISTFNAEENRHMLSVNEALGFRAAGHAGCWRKA